MNNHSDILDEIIKWDLLDLDVKVERNFIDPVSQSQINDEFPYITFLFEDFEMQENSLRVVQKVSVFGFIKSIEGLEYKRSDLLVNVATKLKKRIKFNSGSMANIFSPFGLKAFLDPPYAGFRLSGVIGFDLKQAPTTTITQAATNWLLLNGAQLQFLNGNDAQFIGTP